MLCSFDGLGDMVLVRSLFDCYYDYDDPSSFVITSYIFFRLTVKELYSGLDTD